jgi:hypothetical protein
LTCGEDKNTTIKKFMGEGRWAGLLGGDGREAAMPRGGVEEVLIIELN